MTTFTHVARHTNATLLLMQGVGVSTVQKLLGHKNVKTTMNYCEVINQTIIKELKKAEVGSAGVAQLKAFVRVHIYY